jgi:hypothetical protein
VTDSPQTFFGFFGYSKPVRPIPLWTWRGVTVSGYRQQSQHSSITGFASGGFTLKPSYLFSVASSTRLQIHLASVTMSRTTSTETIQRLSSGLCDWTSLNNTTKFLTLCLKELKKLWHSQNCNKNWDENRFKPSANGRKGSINKKLELVYTVWPTILKIAVINNLFLYFSSSFQNNDNLPQYNIIFKYWMNNTYLKFLLLNASTWAFLCSHCYCYCNVLA